MGESLAERLRPRVTSVEHTPHGPFTRSVYRIRMPVLKGMVAVSVYRIGDLLIDTGCPNSADALIESLRDDPPSRVICTHQHEDHVGGISALREAFGAIDVFVPREHIPVIEAGAPVPRYRSESWGHPTAVSNLEPIDPGDVFEVDGVVLRAEPTPGHTPGHTTYVAEVGSKVYALTGDLYLSATPNYAFFEASAPDRIASCRKLAAYGDSLVMLPTHPRPRDDGAVLLADLADWFEELSERFEEVAVELGTRDPVAIALHHFGKDPMRTFSDREASAACLVRSVFSPVTSLPAPTPP